MKILEAVKQEEDGTLTQLYVYDLFDVQHNTFPRSGAHHYVASSYQYRPEEVARLVENATRKVLNKFPHMALGHPSNLMTPIVDELTTNSSFIRYSPPQAPPTIGMAGIIDKVKRSPVEVKY